MRTPLTLIATFALVLPACGDDGGTDDTSSSTTNTTMTDTGTSTSTTGTSTSTTGTSTSTSTTTTGMDTGSETGMADTGTGTGMADTGTGTGGSAACEEFCATFFEACIGGEMDWNDYGTEDDCVTACADFPEAEFGCREDHLEMAVGDDDPDSVHCDHANLDYNCP